MIRLAPLAVLLVCAGCAASRPGPPETSAPMSPDSPEARAVIAVAQRLFDGMEARDSVALFAVLHPDAVIVPVGADGSAEVVPGRAWARSIAGAPAPLIERMTAPRVEIAGELATLWTAYDFHIGPRFSHCGTDAFQFARTGGVWRLLVVTFTRQREGCPAR